MAENASNELSTEVWTGQIPRVALFTLADRAEVLNGKLYLMGGLISNYRVGSFPGVITIGVALAVEVPWNATNRAIPISISFETQDGEKVGRIDAVLTAGRPPLLTPGASQHIPFAIPGLNMQVKGAGTLVVSATVDGREDRRLSLSIIAASNPTGQ